MYVINISSDFNVVIKEEANMKIMQTFENFFVDGINIARDFAIDVVESETASQYPLCIYGRSGTGKTHLLKAIKNYNYNKKNSMYMTCKELTNKFAYVCKINDIEGELNHKFGHIDILLIDNIEFLIKSTLAQKIFTYVYNYMLNGHKQIVVAAKGDIKELPYHIYKKLCSGLYIETQKTTYKQRLEVLKNEIEKSTENINKEVLEYIALNIYTDMRSTIRCLKKIIKICRNSKESPSIEICKKYLRYDIIAQLREKIVPEYVIKVVADIFDISLEDLMSNSECRYKRSMAMYMCWKLFELKVYELNEIFGNRTRREIVDGILEIEKLYLYANGDTVGQMNEVNYRIRFRKGIENMDRWDYLIYSTLIEKPRELDACKGELKIYE